MTLCKGTQHRRRTVPIAIPMGVRLTPCVGMINKSTRVLPDPITMRFACLLPEKEVPLSAVRADLHPQNMDHYRPRPNNQVTSHTSAHLCRWCVVRDAILSETSHTLSPKQSNRDEWLGAGRDNVHLHLPLLTLRLPVRGSTQTALLYIPRRAEFSHAQSLVIHLPRVNARPKGFHVRRSHCLCPMTLDLLGLTWSRHPN